MAVRRPWLAGLRPVPGSLALMALRWLLFVLAALPGFAVALGGIGRTIGNRPYFTEAPDPLPMLPLLRFRDQLPGSVWGMLLLAAIIAWLGNLLLTAGAVTLFSRAGGGRPRVWTTVFEAGARHLWVYLRIALVALLLAALGARLIGLAAGLLADHAIHELWTMRARMLLQLGRGLATAGWLTLVGLFAWWCRVIVVADRRRRLRRVLTVVPRLWWRRPFGALVAHFVVASGALVASAAVLVAWRQSAGGTWGWVLLWLLVLAALSFVWHWRLRAGRLLWSSPELVGLRAVPDTPWGLVGRLRRKRPPTPPDRAPA